jgi:hypothetical protein
MDQQLPTQLLPAVPHFIAGIFNIAIPNLIAWILVVVIFFAGAWVRLPRFFERPETGEQTAGDGGSREGRKQ